MTAQHIFARVLCQHLYLEEQLRSDEAIIYQILLILVDWFSPNVMIVDISVWKCSEN